MRPEQRVGASAREREQRLREADLGGAGRGQEQAHREVLQLGEVTQRKVALFGERDRRLDQPSNPPNEPQPAGAGRASGEQEGAPKRQRLQEEASPHEQHRYGQHAKNAVRKPHAVRPFALI